MYRAYGLGLKGGWRRSVAAPQRSTGGSVHGSQSAHALGWRSITSRSGRNPSVYAQAKPKLRFSAAFPETDLRAEGYKAFAAAMKDDFDFEPYWANTLFKQGTELVALQRENLELCNLAPADISKQIPAWSLMTSAYLFRDYDHLVEDIQKRRRPGVRQDGARPAWCRTDPPGLLWRAPDQPQADQEDQYAGRSRRHQAAHAAWRVLAIPR